MAEIKKKAFDIVWLRFGVGLRFNSRRLQHYVLRTRGDEPVPAPIFMWWMPKPARIFFPSLLMAAHIEAGLDGIKNRIDPGDTITPFKWTSPPIRY